MAWRKNSETHYQVWRFGRSNGYFRMIRREIFELRLPPYCVRSSWKVYADVSKQNPLIFKGEGRLVKVLFFDKDSAIEALKRNASNPDFPMKTGFNHFFPEDFRRFRAPIELKPLIWQFH